MIAIVKVVGSGVNPQNGEYYLIVEKGLTEFKIKSTEKQINKYFKKTKPYYKLIWFSQKMKG